jgi:hypothetical protein
MLQFERKATTWKIRRHRTKNEDVSSKYFSSYSNDEELDFEKYLDKIERSKSKRCRLSG